MINNILKRVISKSRFLYFESKIHPQTWRDHDRIKQAAENNLRQKEVIEKEEYYLSSCDPIVKQGYQLRVAILNKYHCKYDNSPGMRILVHVPTREQSIGGFSCFGNFVDALNFLAINNSIFFSGHDIQQVLEEFKPSVFISSDDTIYRDSLDWDSVDNYKNKRGLLIGLTASIESDGNTPLSQRLKWAKRHRVDFYYSFQTKKYLNSRKEYNLFFSEGYKIISIEFGANPLVYYPVPNIERDLKYVFLASSNPDKRERYYRYLNKIFKKHSGFIDGPGWSKISEFISNKELHRYVYARCKIGINLHIDISINGASELNERTYILAMCGVPQLIDNAQLISERFSQNALFIADAPGAYYEMFEYMLSNPDEAQKRALAAQVDVYRRHTSFHRAEEFVLELKQLLNAG